MSKKKKNKNNKSIQTKKPEVSGKLFTKTDYIAMAVLTLTFLIMVLFKLGSGKAPETSMDFSQDTNHEIVLDFGDYVDVQSLDVFLGCNNSRRVGLSTFNEVTRQWQIIDEDYNIESVFAWNNVPINYNLRYLGIVFLDDKATVNEIFCKAPNGNSVMPVNYEDYDKLFDEQQLHPRYKSYYDSTMFDEVYHGRTGYEILHGIAAYETTHPHLGKELIALGIGAFGMNPFGWRIIIALFGTIMVPVIYMFAKRITKNTWAAIATGVLIVFDCMHYSISRIATIDIIVAVFILLMYYFMYAYLEQADKETKNAYRYLLLSGLFLGFGIATKFTGVYAGLGLAVIFIAYTIKHFPKKSWKKLTGLSFVFFIVIPLIIYTLSFAPVVEYAPSSNLITKTINGTKSMFNYHANLEATHYYSSQWYSWPVITKPLLYAHDIVEGGKISSVSLMGNPLIWWIMIPCIIYQIYNALFKKDRKALFLVVAYFAQYVPWMLVTRCLFIYHYFPSALFGILIMGYTIHKLSEKSKKWKIGIICYLAAVAMIFLVLFPAISGVPVEQSYLLSLKWLPQWVITY